MSWGAGRWGEDVWAESGAGITHSLQARGGVSTTADAERLGAKHILEARLRIKTESFQIGQGPAPIHPMIAAPAAITTTTFGSSLTRLHNMAAIAAIATSGEPARLKVGHHMTAVAVVSTGNTGRLRQKHPMAASAAINSGAAAVRLIHSHLLEGRAVVRTATAGRYTIAIPDILPPDALAPDAPDVVVPGIVNLARNPDGRGELEGWHGLNFAVVDPDPARPWNGEQSIHVVAPGAVANEGVIGDSHYPLGLAPVGGSIVWGQAMIASETLVQLHAWVRVYFTDGSYDTGLASEPTYAGGLGFGGDWSLIQAPPVSLTAGRVVDFIELYLANASLPTLTPVEWWVGGAQIEYDRWQYGPTPVLTEGIELAETVALAESPLWTPAELPLDLWFDASRLSLTAGERAASLPDESGSGHDATLPAGAVGAVYEPTGLHGWPALRFNVDGDATYYLSPLLSSLQDATALVVVRPEPIPSGAGQNMHSILGKELPPDGGIEFGPAKYLTTTGQLILYGDPADWPAPGANYFVENNSVALDIPSDMVIGFSLPVAGDGAFHVNGVDEPFAFYDEPSDPSWTPDYFEEQGVSAARLMIGRGYGPSFDWFIGRLAEVVITRGALSQDDLDRLTGYLHHKYRLRLPAGHPYAAAPPRLVPVGA